jgi:hypothetical protein
LLLLLLLLLLLFPRAIAAVLDLEVS